MIDTELKIMQTPLYFYIKDAERLGNCYDSIMEKSENKKSIPAKLINEFFSYFIDPDEVNSKRTNMESSKMKPVIDKVVERFKSQYYFNLTIEREERIPSIIPPVINWGSNNSGKTKVIKQKPQKRKPDFVRKYSVTYNLQLLISSVLNYPITKESINSKDECIKFIHKKIKQYCDGCTENGIAPLSRYAQGVITGYITQQLGYKLTSNKTDLTNQELYDKVRNALGSFKKKKSG